MKRAPLCGSGVRDEWEDPPRRRSSVWVQGGGMNGLVFGPPPGVVVRKGGKKGVERGTWGGGGITWGLRRGRGEGSWWGHLCFPVFFWGRFW